MAMGVGSATATATGLVREWGSDQDSGPGWD